MALFGLIDRSTMYFPGCYSSAFASEKIENYKRILKKLDIKFWVSDMVCCGGFFEENGYDKNLRKIVRENFDFLTKKEVTKIITSCPLCYNLFKSYKNLMPDWNIETSFILSEILNKLKEGGRIKNHYYENVAYYDSCYLGRYSNITDEPREILKMIGYRIIELPKNKEETLCCGSCGNLPVTNSHLADKIAINFIQRLKKLKIKKLIVADNRAFQHLNKSLIGLGIKPEDLQILEISDIICDGIGVK